MYGTAVGTVATRKHLALVLSEAAIFGVSTATYVPGLETTYPVGGGLQNKNA